MAAGRPQESFLEHWLCLGIGVAVRGALRAFGVVCRIWRAESVLLSRKEPRFQRSSPVDAPHHSPLLASRQRERGLSRPRPPHPFDARRAGCAPLRMRRRGEHRFLDCTCRACRAVAGHAGAERRPTGRHQAAGRTEAEENPVRQNLNFVTASRPGQRAAVTNGRRVLAVSFPRLLSVVARVVA